MTLHENINVVYDPLYSASAPIKHLGCDVMWYNGLYALSQTVHDLCNHRRPRLNIFMRNFADVVTVEPRSQAPPPAFYRKLGGGAWDFAINSS